jgi:syndecan 4
LDDSDPPFLFENVIRLTSDIEEFKEIVKDIKVSGNLDPPEAALDAMLQAVKCKHVVKWRGDALRLLLVATESAFHYGGDGAGYLAGLSEPNDGLCHTDDSGKYNGNPNMDYPSVSQVVKAVEDNSITPIFAVGSPYKDIYKYFSDEVFLGSTYGVLEKDSSNIVELVRKAYLDVSGNYKRVRHPIMFN